MKDVVIAALSGGLGETVAEGELAHLMAAQGYERGSVESLAGAQSLIERSVQAGFLPRLEIATPVENPRKWEEWCPYHDDPHGRHYVHPLHRKSGADGEWVMVTADSGGGQRPSGSRPVFETRTEHRFAQRDVAAWLEAMDESAKCWRSAAIKGWLGAALRPLQSEASAGEPVSCDAASEATRVPIVVFKKRMGGRFSGSLESVCKNKREPYDVAFNGDGTVNEPVFIGIAKSEGKWDEGADALSAAMSPSGKGRVHRA